MRKSDAVTCEVLFRTASDAASRFCPNSAVALLKQIATTMAFLAQWARYGGMCLIASLIPLATAAIGGLLWASYEMKVPSPHVAGQPGPGAVLQGNATVELYGITLTVKEQCSDTAWRTCAQPFNVTSLETLTDLALDAAAHGLAIQIICATLVAVSVAALLTACVMPFVSEESSCIAAWRGCTCTLQLARCSPDVEERRQFYWGFSVAVVLAVQGALGILLTGIFVRQLKTWAHYGTLASHKSYVPGLQNFTISAAPVCAQTAFACALAAAALLMVAACSSVRANCCRAKAPPVKTYAQSLLESNLYSGPVVKPPARLQAAAMPARRPRGIWCQCQCHAAQ